MINKELAEKLKYIHDTLLSRRYGDIALSQFYLRYNSTGSFSIKRTTIEDMYNKLKGQEDEKK